ncbi:MAG: ribosome biogenesis GTPase Der [Candidatus Zixiibacteriota bacterium]|nr:MAG: ribosome biogenesis GTPase Der [candidate division Zixibacteria bacterium]
MSLPIVAIVGRPNVGKSTLFNRLIKTRQAIVDDTPGITRDRLYRQATWNGVDFMVVDTGGLHVGSDDVLAVKVTEQAKIAMEQADVIVYMIDAKVGALEDDLRIIRDMRRSDKRVILAPNKVDDPEKEYETSEFYSLGFETMIPVSALNGLNCGDLLDAIVEGLPRGEPDAVRDETRVAIVGRPNVGKSSLLNAMTGDKITIVADLPGTTRDAIDTRFEMKGRKYVLIDTAGLKKKKIYKNQLEYYTMLRTVRAISRCDIAVIVVDSVDGLVAGDLRIAADTVELYKGLIFAFNKWDIVEKDELTADKLRQAVHRKIRTLSYAPVLFISALTGQRVVKVWESIEKISTERKKRIPTSELNNFIQDMIERRPPPAKKGKFIKIYYVTQPEGDPPTFIFFCNYPRLIENHYVRYLENRIRETYGFLGTPIKMVFKLRS